MERPVNLLMSKKLRIIVTCKFCPISPCRVAGNQKTACLYLVKTPKERKSTDTALVKEQECEFYKIGSIRKKANGVNFITCTFMEI